MYVIYHSSDSFSAVTGTSIISLLENNKGADQIHILYIEKEISEDNKGKLKSIVDKYGRELEFMKMPDWSGELGTMLHTSKSDWLGFGYNRLFLTKYIPDNIDRVLYLDSDTIIERSIEELWNINMNNYYFAGVDDCLSRSYRRICGLKGNGVYCNAGMLLINLKKWREDQVIESFINTIYQNNGYFIFNEQSIINSVFEGEIYVLPLYYNVYSLVFKFEYQELMKLRKPYRYTYDEALYNEARNNPAITHYTGLFCIKHRPWIKNSDHPHKQAFLNYYRLTPWNETPLMEARKNFFSNAVAFLCDYTPKVLMIKIANLVYYYIRPLAFKRRMKKHRRNRKNA